MAFSCKKLTKKGIPMKEADLLPRFLWFNWLWINPCAPFATFCVCLPMCWIGPVFFEPLLWTFLTAPWPPVLTFCVWESMDSGMNSKSSGDLLRRFPLFDSVPFPPFPIFWVCLELPRILAAPLHDPLALHSMLTIEPTAPSAFCCDCDPMKDAALGLKFKAWIQFKAHIMPPQGAWVWLVA